MTQSKVARIGRRYPRARPSPVAAPPPGVLSRLLGRLVAFRRFVRL
jgi:hypothetical protein